jgi:hypothetical protein
VLKVEDCGEEMADVLADEAAFETVLGLPPDLTPSPTLEPSKSNTVYTFFRKTSPTSHWVEEKVCRPIMLLRHALLLPALLPT